MIAIRSALFAIAALCAAAWPARAQQSLPATQNAALRYWLAFAELQDMPAD
jgi:hypothetical protein